VHQIWISPSNRVISATVDYSSVKTVADRHRLLVSTTSTAGELSGGTNNNDVERPWTPKIGVLVIFFAISVYDTHFESRITGYRPRQHAYEIFGIKRRF